MQLEELICNSCGAPLDVPDNANFVKCNHCSVQLAVRRTGSVAYTEILDRLVEQTDELNDRLADLETHQELEALDREWELERDNYMVRGKHGSRHLPTEGGAIAGGIVVTVFGAFWTMMAVGITSQAPSFGPFAIAQIGFPLFGLVFIGFGIYTAIHSHTKAGQYRDAERHYRQRRDELQRRIED